MNEFLSKFKLDSHHTIERFGVSCLVLLIITTILCTSIFTHKVSVDAETLGKDVIYTTKFTTSVSESTGTVEGGFKNKANTDFFLLIHFDDIAKMSTNAEDYQLFVTGADVSGNNSDLKSNPAAVLYAFGSTGYLGIHMHDANGFPKQIMELTIRANNRISSTGEASSAAGLDSSFADHDQFRVYVNPGGSEATIVDVLDDKQMEIFDVYEQVVTRPKEEALRVEMNESLRKMFIGLNAITEYERRLTDDGMAVPDRPEAIRKDVIIAKKGSETLTRDRDMWKDKDGNVIPEEEVTYYLDTDYVVNGGFNFEWQTSSVAESYWKDAYGGTDWVAYLTAKSKDNAESIETSNIKYYYKDGSEFTFNANSETDIGETAIINGDISNLLQAWKTYFDLKRDYQQVQLKKLLLLELDANVASKNWTRNTKENAVFIY